MSQIKPIAQNGSLEAFVYIDDPLPAQLSYLNSTETLAFQYTAFTLITTAHEAVLVDAPTTIAQAEKLADWIAKVIGDRKLNTIYITHGHGDHFFAVPTIQKQFPGARIRATEAAFNHMQLHLSEPVFTNFWVPVFPVLEAEGPPKIDVDSLPSTDNSFIVDGHQFYAIPVVGGDTVASTVLHVPELDLVVTGDVVYGNCYQYFAENKTPELRRMWMKAIDQVADLHPKTVVPSHMQPNESFGVNHLQETKDYILAWERLDAETETWQELEAAAMKAYPNRTGSYILRNSALVAKGLM
ncbi:hypothetical protein BP5796_12912 [Coleophoma crateriformis]|uniref:Metallo-beta-lactamase domain-containing protein n=1 Tax=Coleophoma crateriformis TaxID=565419 RepID=A0A3D8Q4S7_9HELO|nr:hypothetical protein BP5796_12912 [Coleophoma crateriformis]